MGVSVGSAVGTAVGTGVGASVGSAVGTAVGTGVGVSVGSAVGTAVGIGVGAKVGSGVGCTVGAAEGKVSENGPLSFLRVAIAAKSVTVSTLVQAPLLVSCTSMVQDLGSRHGASLAVVHEYVSTTIAFAKAISTVVNLQHALVLEFASNSFSAPSAPLTPTPIALTVLPVLQGTLTPLLYKERSAAWMKLVSHNTDGELVGPITAEMDQRTPNTVSPKAPPSSVSRTNPNQKISVAVTI